MKNKKTIYFILTILILFFILVSTRFLSGEDNWICQNGEWIKHGSPSLPMPTTECK